MPSFFYVLCKASFEARPAFLNPNDINKGFSFEEIKLHQINLET